MPESGVTKMAWRWLAKWEMQRFGAPWRRRSTRKPVGVLALCLFDWMRPREYVTSHGRSQLFSTVTSIMLEHDGKYGHAHANHHSHGAVWEYPKTH